MEPGIHKNMPIEIYHASSGISNSGLGLIAQSPRHYHKRAVSNTKALADGRMIHAAILEPEKFQEQYIFGPDVSRATKAWKTFESANFGKICLKPSETVGLEQAVDAIHNHPLAKVLLRNAEIEQSMAWVDPETGVLCRIRPDIISHGSMADLKKTACSSPKQFARSCVKYGYHRQAAMYMDGYEILTGERLEDFFFIAIEMTLPFCCEVYRVPPEMMESGKNQYRKSLQIYAECLKTDNWPGYGGGALSKDINWPTWADKEI